MADYDIRKGSDYDLTSVLNSDVSISNVAKNDKKLLNIFQKFDLNKDGLLNSIEQAQMFKTLASLDNNVNGRLSIDELDAGANILNEQLGLNDDEKLNSKLLQNFIKKITKISGEKIDINELIPSNDNSLAVENVTNAEMITENGQQVYQINYKDKVLKIHEDKSYEIIETLGGGGDRTTYFDSQNKKYKEHSNYQNGDTETCFYAEHDAYTRRLVQVTNNGTTTTEVLYQNEQAISETVQTEKQRCQYELIDGTLKLVYKEVYKEDTDSTGTIQTTNLMYDENGGCTITIIDKNKTIIQETMDGIDNVYYQKTTTNTEDGNVVEEKFITDDGNLCEKINSGNSLEINCYNGNSDKKLFSYRKDGDKEQYAEYDGEGNTYLVMNYLDKISKIAEASNTTTDEIYNLNSDIVKGKGAKRYFLAGQTIRVPREIDPANEILAHRGTPEEEEARYSEWKQRDSYANNEASSRLNSMPREYTSNSTTFRQLAEELYRREGIASPSPEQLRKRIKELQELNPNIENGKLQGQKMTVRYNTQYEKSVHEGLIIEHQGNYDSAMEKELKLGGEIAKKYYDYINNNSHALEDEEFKKICNEITEDNIVGFLHEYEKNYGSLSEFVNSEGGSGKEDALIYIFDVLKKRAQKSGINMKNIESELNEKQFYKTITKEHYRSDGTSYTTSDIKVDTNKSDLAIEHIINQIKTMESTSPEEQAYNKFQNNDNVDTLLTTAENLHESSTSKFQHQVNTDGWCADVYEWLKSISNSPNTDKKVQAKLDDYLKKIEELKNTYESQGEAAFKVRYKELFNREYDEKIVKAYSTQLSNYEKAVGINELMNKMMTECSWEQLQFKTKEKKTYSLSISTDTVWYGNLINYLQTFLDNTTNKNNDNKLNAEEVLKQYMYNKGKQEDYDSGHKIEYLAQICVDIKDKLQEEYNNLTNNQSLNEMNNALTNTAKSLYGLDNDIMHSVNEYIISQEKGEAYVSIGVKTIAMILSTCIPGSSPVISGVATFASSAAVDMSNEMTGDGLQDGEMRIITAEAGLNGLFAASSTGVRELCKMRYANRPHGNLKTSITASVGQTGVSEAQSVMAHRTPDIALDFLFALGANYLTGTKIISKLKLTIKSNSGETILTPQIARPLRRTSSGVKKEIKENNKSNEKNIDSDSNLNLTNEQYLAEARNLIDQINDLGELNNLYCAWNKIPETQFAKKKDIINMLVTRAKELKKTPHEGITYNKQIPEEIKDRAIIALNQPAKYLRQEQISDIIAYVQSISDKSYLHNVCNKLKEHGLDSTNAPELYQVITNKFISLGKELPEYFEKENCILYANDQ